MLKGLLDKFNPKKKGVLGVAVDIAKITQLLTVGADGLDVKKKDTIVNALAAIAGLTKKGLQNLEVVGTTDGISIRYRKDI